MNTYKCSDGTRIKKSIIDRRVSEAKRKKLESQLDEYGFNFCEDHGKVGCFVDENCIPLDCSHNVSVKECQESGRSELAWDINNITITGRKCHQVKDKLNLQFKG